MQAPGFPLRGRGWKPREDSRGEMLAILGEQQKAAEEPEAPVTGSDAGAGWEGGVGEAAGSSGHQPSNGGSGETHPFSPGLSGGQRLPREKLQPWDPEAGAALFRQTGREYLSH